MGSPGFLGTPGNQAGGADSDGEEAAEEELDPEAVLKRLNAAFKRINAKLASRQKVQQPGCRVNVDALEEELAKAEGAVRSRHAAVLDLTEVHKMFKERLKLRRGSYFKVHEVSQRREATAW